MRAPREEKVEQLRYSTLNSVISQMTQIYSSDEYLVAPLFQVSEEAVMKRKSQGWVMEATHDIDQAINRTQTAAKSGPFTGCGMACCWREFGDSNE